jgi:signal recognition particle receptor subunit beta
VVFFNYSTMQMAAKVVYYGPGLCGKTTNLNYIYRHTAADSRGEIVSLETETDRTLFFDLLPIDVGNVGGFKTRIQLYTVPGQVFYNTTRKLVLKGVDGIVFVADSQRPTIDANLESLRNLEENLAEMGLSLDTLPIVIQYNKRDLEDTCDVAELEAKLNARAWPSFEASALRGDGVFETLRGISRLTLTSVRKRLGAGQPPLGTSGARLETTAKSASPTRPSPANPTPLGQPPTAPAVPAASLPRPLASPAKPAAEPALAPDFFDGPPAVTRPANPAASTGSFRGRSTGEINVAREIEELRRQAGRGLPDGAAKELSRSVQLRLKRAAWKQARKLALDLRVEDGAQRTIDAIQDLKIDLEKSDDTGRIVLKLSVLLSPKD